MKDFVKMLLAVICGLLIAAILKVVVFFAVIGSIAASGGSKPLLPKEGVLDLDLSTFSIGEQAQEMSMSFASFSFDNTTVVGVWDAVRAIEDAATDPAVKYILLRPDGGSMDNAAMLELRTALEKFREGGKAVVAYLENPSNGGCYLSSVADKVYMTADHGITSGLVGIGGRLVYLKDLLDKLGVNVQLIRHGKYKSAGEPYIRSTPSAENLEQYRAMVGSLWGTYGSAIAAGRGMTLAELDALIDGLVLNLPEDFKAHGLVDELLTHEELVQKLCDLAVVEDKEDLHLIAFPDYVAAKVTAVPAKAKSTVAILFADGEIVEGKDYGDVAGDRFVKLIDGLRKDEKVKSVVLRVNSPGGSVLASAKIREALALLRAEKPVVASYGAYAASGGYWISAESNYIFSSPVTLTGSIGVFSMVPDLSKTVKDLAHVNLYTVSSHKHSDMYGMMRPLDKDETAYFQASVEDIYGEFVGIVSAGRGLTPEAVDAIAQGRVWTGADALKIGLVDELGTLGDAVRYAAALAELDEFKTVSYPKPLSTMETLLQAVGNKGGEPDILAGTRFSSIGRALKDLRSFDPSRVYALMPVDIEIR